MVVRVVRTYVRTVSPFDVINVHGNIDLTARDIPKLRYSSSIQNPCGKISKPKLSGAHKSKNLAQINQRTEQQKYGGMMQTMEKRKEQKKAKEHEDAPAANRTRGPSMATMDFTTKPLALFDWLMIKGPESFLIKSNLAMQ